MDLWRHCCPLCNGIALKWLFLGQEGNVGNEKFMIWEIGILIYLIHYLFFTSICNLHDRPCYNRIWFYY